MLRARVVLGMLALALVLTGGSLGQDKKDGKAKGKLPTNWSKLGLSNEQKKQIYAIRGEFADKIQDLDAKLKELRKQELTAMQKVLTDAQKTKLRELVLGEAPAEKSSKDK